MHLHLTWVPCCHLAKPFGLQEKFEEAVPEYNSAVELLRSLEGGLAAHRRRAAELDFKRANALQLIDKPGDALAAIRSAKAHLQVRQRAPLLFMCISCGVVVGRGMLEPTCC
jgi:hypothetical protein